VTEGPEIRSTRGADLRFIVDSRTGRLLVQESGETPGIRDVLQELVGSGAGIACATPRVALTLPSATPDELASAPCVRLAGYWHDSLIEGPGRRSVAKLQGCPLRCSALCITPDSWDAGGGVVVTIDCLVDALLDLAFERDGVSILGGEPTAQPDGLLALVRALRVRGCPHILVYSGHTYEGLRRIAERVPAIATVLDEADVLIDGPYLPALADGCGPWTGSRNQRVIDLAATRRLGRIALLDESLDCEASKPT
jgi:anaerobic ribonucleoside-triphosphate reductase activating protein